MKAHEVVNKLLEADEDVGHYLSGIVPHEQPHEAMEDFLASRGFRFREYDGTPPVLVNRWIYQSGRDYWVINPIFHLEPERDYWNMQWWRDGKMMTSQAGQLRWLMQYFDRERRE